MRTKKGTTAASSYTYHFLLAMFCLSPIGFIASADTSTTAVTTKNIASENLPANVEQLRQHRPKQLPNRYIVEFRQPPIAKLASAQSTSLKNILETHSNSVENKLKANVKALKQRAPGVDVFQTYSTLLNGVAITASDAEIKKLSGLPQVKRIYPVRLRYLAIDSSHQVIRTQAAWIGPGNYNNFGQGIKIAVVDTGIRNDHPLFTDGGIEPLDVAGNLHLQQNPDYCRSQNDVANFCNNKIAVARWIDPTLHGVEIYQHEYLSPLDFDGHGSHVAGIAAGTSVRANYEGTEIDIHGVAPLSHLMVYKALYTSPFGVTYGSDTMLLEALEMAVLDGADVINNSWGAGSGEDPDSSIYQGVFDAAEAAGIVVVNAAGNTGHPGATINCPACIESGIAVANTTHGRFFGHRIGGTGNTWFAYPGQAPALQQAKAIEIMSLSSLTTNSNDGCSPFPELDLTGKALLVPYQPNCPLSTVSSHAQTAGVELVLAYYAGVFGQASYEPLLPFDEGFNVPVLGMSQEAALEMEAEITATGGSLPIAISDAIEPYIEQQFVDVANPFSSTGPNNNPNYLKPDLSAPGTNILSAYSPDQFSMPDFPFGPNLSLPPAAQDMDLALLSGTSMAAPHVAGTAALLKQAYPDWSAQRIKAAMMATANPNVLLGSELAGPFEKGAGRLDAGEAMQTQLTFSEASYSNPACIGTCQFETQIEFLANSRPDWTLSVQMDDAFSSATVSPQTLQRPGGANPDAVPVTITIDVEDSDPDHPLYDKWLFGQLTATSSTGETRVLPMAVYANDASDQGSLLLSYDGSDLQSNQPVPFSARIRNTGGLPNAEITIDAPNNARFVAGSEQLELNNGSSDSLSISQDNSQLQWSGNLDQGSMQLEAANLWGTYLLAEQGISPIACDEGCGFVNAVVEFDFTYNGKSYSSLTISDNGFVVPGEANYGFITALFNQNFPQQDSLNNIIAPFWTEFDLLDPNLPGDTGKGELRAAVRVVDEVNYLVVEWYQAALFQIDSGEGEGFPPAFPDEEEVPATELYSFQLIIEEGTDNIWFHYIDIPAMPENVSIGAENEDGSIGIAYYFDGAGTPVGTGLGDSGQTLQLTSTSEGVATIHFELSPQGTPQYAQNDSFSIEEDASATAIDLLANDRDYIFVTATAQNQTGTDYKAISSARLPVASGLDLDSITIINSPDNGTISLEQGQVSYQPAPNFFGTDTFTYTIQDNDGVASANARVVINVNGINDSPVIAPITSGNVGFEVNEQENFSITAEGTDADGDTLVYSWSQQSGPSVNLTVDGNQMSFVAPQVQTDTIVSFSVTAYDDTSNSEPVSFSVTIVDSGSSSGGGASWYITLLLVFGLGYRRIIKRRASRQDNI